MSQHYYSSSNCRDTKFCQADTELNLRSNWETFLRRLLLVRGQWSYYRICILLCYFLYKTTAFALVRVWYGFYNGFNTQDNMVRSYKYTPLTFLPLNLYEQFHRAANLFFLLIVVLQCVPMIATIPWYSTMLPLLFVLLVRGCKDLATDLADLLLLCSTEPHSLCYVETADIDGETNLKFRQALSVTHAELNGDSVKQNLAAFDGIVWCEEPNGNLHSFKGELHWKEERHLLDTDHLLLRGTVLQNTDKAYGLVIYTGADSKILQNCGKLKLKKTRVEILLNKTVLVILLSMLTAALLLAVGAGLFEHRVSPQYEVVSVLQRDSSPAYLGFITFWGYIILLSPSMPMSLYITFEVIHMVHCLLIGWDIEMYWEDNNSPAQARTTTLNEELGQVGHLLSDKTGTLTQNRLLFRQCFIAGHIYGDMSKEIKLFAQSCLRTLCVAVRLVPEALWTEWSRALSQAGTSTGNQETALEEIYNQMEKDLTLLGVTAIEDRLQEGVPETISTLRRAGVKVWVLTGDKTETAVNVGYACKLMDPDTTLIQGEELRQLLESPSPDVHVMSKELEVWITDRTAVKSKAALVISGPELAELTKTPEWGARFVALSDQCQSVLCCRVTPAQKAEVVEMVRKHSTSITMAIGDGANDVNMIKTAHIGVGLCGVEGGQAVQNADFALAQFSFLRRLLLVHGHWSYYRICILLRYFLYKTTAFALVHIWYSFYNGFSAQPMYESWFISLYTTLYTSIPIQCMGMFEQDVSAKSCLSWPEIYSVGQKKQLFNPLVLAMTLLYSFYTSIILFFIPMGILQYSALDYQTLAITIETSVVLTTTVEVILHTKFWTKFSVAAVIFSLVAFFLSTLALHGARLFTASPKDYFFLGIHVCRLISVHVNHISLKEEKNAFPFL
ncbi:phospholipid-transporting ATPase IC-like protein [Labeo rohita]|uniref:Phospholipid-transporting ATPase n=1 Tax=Labeo rohita TaxID=84645 RepID=A0A498NH91_LABRO|nr:phospholipid-transporting ATPase IC-like protein [Labeo rohita]